MGNKVSLMVGQGVGRPRQVSFDPDATVGSVVGSNLTLGQSVTLLSGQTLPAGYVLQASDILNGLVQSNVAVSSDQGADWPRISNRPPNVDAIGAMTGTGFVVRKASGSYITPATFVLVMDTTDLPTAIAGVITLAANATYLFIGTVDLAGARLVGSQNTTIIGGSSENSRIKSTGLSASTALITSAWSIPIRSITIEHGTALNLDAIGNPGQAIDWLGVNFTDCATVGRIANYSNVLFTDCALLNSAELTFDGTIGTVGAIQTIFSGIAGKRTIIIPPTAAFPRRFRIIYSAFVTPATGTGIDFSSSATVPDEAYILDTVNFGGGGTAQTGVNYTSNKASFINCVGITNSTAVCQYYMNNNATATTISATGTFYKIAGTTTGSSGNQKFDTSTSNRAVYTGASTNAFRVVVTAAINSGNNQTLRCRIGKSGTTIPDSETELKTSSAGESSNLTIQTIVELSTGQYPEVFVANDTAPTNATAKHLNVIITRIN